MFALNLPGFEMKIREKDGKRQIFDFLRRRYVALSPEEWVRQHFCHYLCEHKHFPSGRMANEYSIEVCGTKKRCDTVVFDSQCRPLVIVEYKAPEVRITQEVFMQILRYDWTLKAPYLLVSNGLCHYGCRMDYEAQRYDFLREIPDFNDLKP